MANIDNITVEGFKALFTRDFPYLPVWQSGKMYFKDDVVYYKSYFFQSTIDGNMTSPDGSEYHPDDDSILWRLYNDTIFNYVSDDDILRAFAEAKVNFNPALFPDNETAIMVFYYLAAHYLVIDLHNAQNPLAVGFMGFTQSKSVGSVSESFLIPSWVQTNKMLSPYMSTGYGQKYLSLIMPYLVGNVIHTPGRINFD